MTLTTERPQEERRVTYQLFPNLTADEMEALTQDIRERGVLVPVEVDETGAILDGHHRAQIADSLGIDYPTVVREGWTEEQKLEHVFALNIARRHLSGHDRTAVISECRRRGMSLRAIARAVGVSKSTVGNVLNEEVVQKWTPDIDNPEPEPLPPPVTRTERARQLQEEGLSQDLIAAALGVTQSTVSYLLNGKTDGKNRSADAPADWSRTKALLADIKALPDKTPEPRVFAQTVPARNRASVARTLRRVGTLLGSIALELERSDR